MNLGLEEQLLYLMLGAIVSVFKKGQGLPEKCRDIRSLKTKDKVPKYLVKYSTKSFKQSQIFYYLRSTLDSIRVGFAWMISSY